MLAGQSLPEQPPPSLGAADHFFTVSHKLGSQKAAPHCETAAESPQRVLRVALAPHPDQEATLHGDLPDPPCQAAI